ncbi:hypothetical protein MAV101_09975 [Mycobacterium avium subsp. hominissuis 101]|jgi:hypothetical protein|uniref:Uncharacterized protein n=1 Tax=Mycobacterium avium (strain 104) TaxID=243243 RepID=A0A0H2ZWS5_MYCA1|nr:hypothetical protein MAV_1983 [Mycobacterium avium 104]ETA92418.1 hypothetical protein O982_23595 [Mycobacterium avium 10-5581]ETA93189.1 hypothetical protein O984_10245 [Mycobacterium avium 05-4293]ETB26281.1 hypothetical protein O983_08825 [Mycobacterium avium 09-5983]ETB30622.1 hypothetical protein O971_09160 [Mycobacterium avium subsp. hominissuis 10-4249]ETB38914.1 hypothetical protein O974_26635 [Mycobacterium avium 11-0986]ETB42444.1 hypothetical protein N602_08325 [Mycobacterium av
MIFDLIDPLAMIVLLTAVVFLMVAVAYGRM